VDASLHACLRRGADLFNRRLFFEAHDAWEDGWRVRKGQEPAELLQGLIQIAAGFVKLERRRPRGMLSLLDGGAAKLRAIPAGRYPVDLEALLASVEGWILAARHMLETGATDYDPERLPSIVLQPPEQS